MSLMHAPEQDDAMHDLPPELEGMSARVDELAEQLAGDQASDPWVLGRARELVVRELLGRVAFHRNMANLVEPALPGSR